MTRDERFLRHLGRYRLSLPRIAAEHFYKEGTWKAAVKRLQAEGHVERRTTGAAPEGFTYLQISIDAANRLGLHVTRAKPFRIDNDSLHKNLAVLWFCFMGPPPGRVRVENSEYPRDVLGPPPTEHGPICVEKGVAPGGYRFLRVLVPSEDLDWAPVMSTMRTEIGRMLAHQLSRQALRSGSVGFTLLVETPERREQAGIAISQLRQQKFFKTVHIDARLAPGPKTLNHYLRASSRTACVDSNVAP